MSTISEDAYRLLTDYPEAFAKHQVLADFLELLAVPTKRRSTKPRNETIAHLLRDDRVTLAMVDALGEVLKLPPDHPARIRALDAYEQSVVTSGVKVARDLREVEEAQTLDAPPKPRSHLTLATVDGKKLADP